MKFRKRPVVIDAVKFVYSTKGIEELKAFCGECLGSTRKDRHPGAVGEAHIITLEDGGDQVQHFATEGDWVIKGVHGEFYPCKPDIFEKTYERVLDDE